MRPTNWTQLSRREQLRQATDLFASHGGKLVISEALYLAIQFLQSAPKNAREESDIQDMEVLYETIFDQFDPPNNDQNRFLFNQASGKTQPGS
jgi:hypothetical protein